MPHTAASPLPVAAAHTVPLEVDHFLLRTCIVHADKSGAYIPAWQLLLLAIDACDSCVKQLLALLLLFPSCMTQHMLFQDEVYNVVCVVTISHVGADLTAVALLM